MITVGSLHIIDRQRYRVLRYPVTLDGHAGLVLLAADGHNGAPLIALTPAELYPAPTPKPSRPTHSTTTQTHPTASTTTSKPPRTHRHVVHRYTPHTPTVSDGHLPSQATLPVPPPSLLPTTPLPSPTPSPAAAMPRRRAPRWYHWQPPSSLTWTVVALAVGAVVMVAAVAALVVVQ